MNKNDLQKLIRKIKSEIKELEDDLEKLNSKQHLLGSAEKIDFNLYLTEELKTMLDRLNEGLKD